MCRYNQVDATRGGFLSFDYALALRQLGGNISFNRYQATYQALLQSMGAQRHGAGGQHNARSGELLQSAGPGRQWGDRRDRFDVADQRAVFPGGSTTLRGFNFEEAGPREVVIPLGPFRDQDKNLVFSILLRCQLAEMRWQS